MIAGCKGGGDACRYLGALESGTYQCLGRALDEATSRANYIVKVKNLLVGVSFARALARSLRNRVDRGHYVMRIAFGGDSFAVSCVVDE